MKNNKPTKKVAFNCLNCSKIVIRYPVYPDRTIPKFCSLKCSAAYKTLTLKDTKQHKEMDDIAQIRSELSALRNSYKSYLIYIGALWVCINVIMMSLINYLWS